MGWEDRLGGLDWGILGVLLFWEGIWMDGLGWEAFGRRGWDGWAGLDSPGLFKLYVWVWVWHFGGGANSAGMVGGIWRL